MKIKEQYKEYLKDNNITQDYFYCPYIPIDFFKPDEDNYGKITIDEDNNLI